MVRSNLARVRRMPEEARRLRAPWPPLAREVPHLTPELEREFRFGQRVAMTERGFLLGGTIKGGSSSMWIPATADQYEAYLRWRLIDGFVEDGDPRDFDELVAFLAPYGIALVNGRTGTGAGERHHFRADLGALYALLAGIVRELPTAHLASTALERIQIGGWGPDSAKGSAYSEGTVYLYDFAVRGARRTCIGLFLHELGHAFEHGLRPVQRDELRAIHHVLNRAGAFFSTEYLLDRSSRSSYQRLVFEEFVAETYLAFTACGGALRAHIASVADSDAHQAWRYAYALFRTAFEGFEYE